MVRVIGTTYPYKHGYPSQLFGRSNSLDGKKCVELYQMIVKLLKEELFYRFCNKSRHYRSHKVSGIDL